MRVIEVTYIKTKQVNPYEPEKIELKIMLEENENVREALAKAQETVALEFDEDLQKLEKLQTQICERYGKEVATTTPAYFV